MIDLPPPPAFWLPPKPAIIRQAPDIKAPLLGIGVPGIAVKQVQPYPARSFVGIVLDDTVGGTSFNFNADIGKAVNNRAIIMAAQLQAGAAPNDITGTIAGTAFSTIATATSGSTRISFVGAFVPASAGAGSQAIVINDSTSLSNIAVAMWRTTGLTSLTSFATAIASTADPGTGTINVASEGLLFAAARCGTVIPTYTWTGVVEDFDQTIGAGSRQYSGGSYSATIAETARTVTATRSLGGGNNFNMVCVSLR